MTTAIRWTRTCQECGHRQTAHEPNKDRELPLAYTNAKCKRCKSEALDYGKWQEDDET